MSLELASEIGNVVLTAGSPALEPDAAQALGGAIAVGLAAFGAGYAERGIGAAAVGAMAENEDLFVRGLILTVLPETLVILALLVVLI